MKPIHLLLLCALLLLAPARLAAASARDIPFRQPVAVRFNHQPELSGARYQKVVVQRDGIAYLLTDRGVARVFGDQVAIDQSFRPLVGRTTLDLFPQRGSVFYLLDDSLLANDFSGSYHVALPKDQYRAASINTEGLALLAAPTNLLLVAGTKWTTLPFSVPRKSEKIYTWLGRFYVLADDTVYRLSSPQIDFFHRGSNLTALAFTTNEVIVGTHNGWYGLDLETGKATTDPQIQLPATNITCLLPLPEGMWVGTTHGAFFQTGPKSFRYYASRRWLPDDEVVDIAPSPTGDIYILTRGGLARIDFPLLTLADKAQRYDDKIRQRHMRYGFCAELRLKRPGDITSAEMIDTDNDGTWSSTYLASQAFRYAVTGDEKARANAWETFDALERLQTINGVEGFPSRTFERTGFKVSDPERWHTAPERHWEWKAHTSSDEITAHTFAYAALLEAAARTPAERARIAGVYDRILSHIVRNNFYLIDVDGQPTLWGRWNPEYVNGYPPTIVDRRLNSAEIIAFLEFGYHTTRNELYKTKAFELMRNHGYLQNITNSMAQIRATPGFVFRGNDMGDEWNHSDDELAFHTYWTLYRFAFDDHLRTVFAAAIRDHWQIEKVERNPLWSFVYAGTGAQQFELENALWTLRMFPLDLVDWTVRNSHRRDLTRLPPNFRGQETAELLPADERPIMRWNGNPFTLDGGSDGGRELAGDEFLLPYWMGRYLKVIE